MQEKKNLDLAVATLYYQWFKQTFLNHFATAFTLLLLTGSVLTLLLRFLQWRPFPLGYVAAAAWALASGYAVNMLFRKPVTRAEISAILDRGADAGGLLVSQYEKVDVGAWATLLQTKKASPFRVSYGKQILMIAGSLLFFGACLWTPMPGLQKYWNRPLDITPMTSAMEQKIETLLENSAIEPEQAESMKKTLRELEHNQDAFEPSKLFEPLDSMDQTLKNLADSAAQKMLEKENTMAEMETLSRNLAHTQNPADNERLRKMAENFSKQLEQQTAPGISDPFSPALQQAMENFLNQKLTPQQMQALTDALKNSRAELADRLKKLSESGIPEAKREALKKFLKEQRSNCPNCSDGSCKACRNADRELHLSREELEKLRKACKECNGTGLAEDGSPCASCGGTGFCETPGNGGISRGRGDAPMIYTPADNIPIPGKPERLKSGSVDPKLSETLGITLGEPETKAVDDGAGGALKTGQGKGGEARVQPVSPKNRRAVKNFFQE